MALTDIINQETAQAILRPDFSINSNSFYDRKTFVEHAKSLFDLKEHSSKLRENTNNFDALYDLIEILRKYTPGDEATNITRWENDSHEALKEANTWDSQGSFAMGKFIERKREKLLDKLSEKELYSLFQRTPIYEGDSLRHKKIKALSEKVYGMQMAAKEGQDPSQVIVEDVRQLIEMASDDKKEFIMRNQKAMIASLNVAVMKSLQKEYSNLFKNADGQLNASQIKSFLKDNYQIAEDFINGVPNEEKPKYWNDNLKPQYLQLANVLYGSEKKDQKYADNKPKEERKERARALGLAA